MSSPAPKRLTGLMALSELGGSLLAVSGLRRKASLASLSAFVLMRFCARSWLLAFDLSPLPRPFIPWVRSECTAERVGLVGLSLSAQDEEPVVILRSHKVVAVRQNHDEFSFEIEYEIHPETVEYHYIRCEDEEDFDK